MINADAFIMDSKKTLKRSFFIEEERPIGIQISGSDKKNLVLASKKIEIELKPDILDINIGCPAYNVMKTGSGAKLLNDINKLGDLVKSISESLNIPFTCKIRITTDENYNVSIAKTIEKSGANAITVHGRTANQKYSGKANWDIVKKIKNEVKIPIILNGDIIDEKSAKNALGSTGCDALMIGRASVGDPYLFNRINYFLKNEKYLPDLSKKEKIIIFFEFLELAKKHDCLYITNIKMHAQHFTKSIVGSTVIRKQISESKNIEDIELIMKNFINN